MARIRSIKPEFWISLTIAKLSPLARLTFIGLWNYCDDHGRGLDDARLIKATVWPLDDHASAKRIEGWLSEIHTLGLIQRYEADAKSCVAVTNWTEHQRVDHPKDSLLPPPPSREDRENVATAREAVSLEGKGREQGDGREMEGSVALAVQRDDVDGLCTLLSDLIEANTGRRPTITSKWRDECRLLLDRDHRSPAFVEQVIRWATADPFWNSNILGMPKLREKFDQLALRMNAPNGKAETPAERLLRQGREMAQ